VKYSSCFARMLTNVIGCTHAIKLRIAMTKAKFSKKIKLKIKE
jgi:hypothetical protein